METIQLINNEHTEVAFLSRDKTLIMKLKGIVSKNHLRSLRANVTGMIESLGAQQLVMNTLDSEYQELDFTDKERKEFYKEAEINGIREFTIVYPNLYFIREIQSQWRAFFKKNDIKITVSASLS